MNNQDQINLLSYPRLNVPSESWLKVALLYYDKIATIIPADIYENEVTSKYIKSALLDQDTISLLKNGLIEKLSLDSPYDYEVLNKKFSQFYKSSLTNKRKESLRIAEFNFQIYASKFSFEIFHQLQGDELAIQAPFTNESPYESYFVPEKLGIAMMHLLAEYIAALDGYNISTDKIEYSFALLEKNNPLVKRKNFTNVFLSCHFPIPDDMSINQILEFKDYFGAELRDFRQKVLHFENQILKVSPEHVFEYISDEKDHYDKEEKIIIEGLKSKGYKQITFTKIATAAKDIISDSISGSPWRTLKNIYKSLNSGELPILRNQNNYPALFKYTYPND